MSIFGVTAPRRPCDFPAITNKPSRPELVVVSSDIAREHRIRDSQKNYVGPRSWMMRKSAVERSIAGKKVHATAGFCARRGASSFFYPTSSADSLAHTAFLDGL